MDNQAHNKLVSLLTKPNHLMVDVLHLHQSGELKLTDDIIRDTVAKLADNAKAKSTIVFLLNVVKHQIIFDKINVVMRVKFKRPQEMTAEEFDKLLLSKTVSKFRAALELTAYLNGELAMQLYGATHEKELFKTAKEEQETQLEKSLDSAEKAKEPTK